jgi:hypothetical protein
MTYQRLPLLRDVTWLEGRRVRLRFRNKDRRSFVTELPTDMAYKARVIDLGMGLDPGDGFDFSAADLYDRLINGKPITHSAKILEILDQR